jgi:protein arginine N-methyltransferase 2
MSELLSAVRAGDLNQVTEMLNSEKGADLYYEEPGTGCTALMAAAEQGRVDLVEILLDDGAAWNAIDLNGRTAAEIALDAGHRNVWELLLGHGVRTELLLGFLDRRAKGEEEGADPSNADYLSKKLVYKDGKLLDSSGDAVMMAWETPLMKKHAELLDVEGKDILNVGFGLGIIDKEFQKYKPRSHTIIEAHPDVYAHMLEQGWDKIPGVRIVFGRWQDVLEQLVPCGYDAIYFDTYGEFYDDMRDFHEALLDLLRPMTGVYSFFNGLAAKNPFFHEVSCQVADLELQKLGLETTWTTMPIDPDSSEIWEGVKRKYWTLKEYKLPMCHFIQ